MYNLKINFSRIIKDNLVKILRTPIRVGTIRAMVRPFRTMLTEFTKKKDELFYKASFNGTQIYLETALNDRFSPVDRSITITSVRDLVYIYRKSELRPARYIYRRWDAATSFDAGKFCIYNGEVYEANATALNKEPGVDVEWDLRPDLEVLKIRSVSETQQFTYFVNIPATVTFNEAALRGILAYFQIIGINYTIIIT